MRKKKKLISTKKKLGKRSLTTALTSLQTTTTKSNYRNKKNSTLSSKSSRSVLDGCKTHREAKKQAVTIDDIDLIYQAQRSKHENIMNNNRLCNIM